MCALGQALRVMQKCECRRTTGGSLSITCWAWGCMWNSSDRTFGGPKTVVQNPEADKKTINGQETTHIIETSKNNPETAWLVWLVVAILWMVGTKVGLVLCTSCLASNLHMHTARDGTHSSLNPPRVDQSWEGIGWYHTKWNWYLNAYHW